MDVKQAIAIAKQYVRDLYEEEQISNLGLEEVTFMPDTRQWNITVAFSRPWNSQRSNAAEVIEKLGGITPQKRSYKVVTLEDDGRVLSMTSRARAEVE